MVPELRVSLVLTLARCAQWEHDAADKVRSEYEYKLAMLQNRVAELEREQREHADGAGASERGLREQWDQERRRWEQVRLPFDRPASMSHKG